MLHQADLGSQAGASAAFSAVSSSSGSVRSAHVATLHAGSDFGAPIEALIWTLLWPT